MKKLLLSLMAVAMCTASFAQEEEEVYTQVYSKTVADWNMSVDSVDWGGNASLKYEAANGLGFRTTKPGAAYSATKTFDITADAKVKYEVTWSTGNSTGRTSNWEYIQFGDKVRISYNSSYNYYLDMTGTSAGATTIVYNYSYATNTITVIFNTATSTVESLTFNDLDLTDNFTNKTLDGKFNSVTFGFQRGGSTSNWEYPNFLAAINVSQHEQTVEKYDYSIIYKTTAGDTIKTTSGQLPVDAVVTAESVVYDSTGVRYLESSATAETMTIAPITEENNNVLDVAVRLPKVGYLVMNTAIADTIYKDTTTITETDAKEFKYSYAFPLYKKGPDGIYYKVTSHINPNKKAENDSITTFGFGGSATKNGYKVASVTYGEADSTMIYFADASTTAGTTYTYSNGEDGYVAAQNARDRGLFAAETLKAGLYKFVGYMTGSNGRSIVLRSGTADPFASISQAKTDATGLKYVYFKLDKDTANVYLNGANSGTAKTNQSENFDYAYIIKSKQEILDSTTVANAIDVKDSAKIEVNTIKVKFPVMASSVVAKATVNVADPQEAKSIFSQNVLTAVQSYDCEVVPNEDKTEWSVIIPDEVMSLGEQAVTIVIQPKDADGNALLDSNLQELVLSKVVITPENYITKAVAVVEAAEAQVTSAKYVQNGQVVIVKDGKKFTAAGAQMK